MLSMMPDAWIPRTMRTTGPQQAVPDKTAGMLAKNPDDEDPMPQALGWRHARYVRPRFRPTKPAIPRPNTVLRENKYVTGPTDTRATGVKESGPSSGWKNFPSAPETGVTSNPPIPGAR